jgi:predicted DNA-binding protein
MNELTERFNFQLRPSEKKRLEELAELEGRTMANMLRVLINGCWETYDMGSLKKEEDKINSATVVGNLDI